MQGITYTGKTDAGLKRKNNEDAFAISREMGFCALADGMGGAAAGEIASRIFVDTVTDVFSGGRSVSGDEVNSLVQNAFTSANKKILDHVLEYPEHRGMGCTAEILAFSDQGFVLGHMGDSRTYRLRGHEFKQLTKDHSLVQEQLDQGIITKEQAQSHQQRNIILRAVGISQSPQLDIIRGKALPGDIFLLCSDGLTDMIRDEQVLAVLVSGTEQEKMAGDLIEFAKQAGGKDNVTVVIAGISRP